MSKTIRNMVTAEAAGRFKSKRFDGRGNRRANSNRNRFDWRSATIEALAEEMLHDDDMDIYPGGVCYTRPARR